MKNNNSIKVDPFTRTPGVAGNAFIDMHYTDEIVEAFTNENTNDYGKLLYMSPENNKVLTIDSIDLDSVALDSMQVLYRVDKIKKKAKLFESFYFIYNGAACGEFSDELLCPDYGSVTLIDNDRDNVYDVLVAQRWYDVVVQTVYPQ